MEFLSQEEEVEYLSQEDAKRRDKCTRKIKKGKICPTGIRSIHKIETIHKIDTISDIYCCIDKNDSAVQAG